MTEADMTRSPIYEDRIRSQVRGSGRVPLDMAYHPSIASTPIDEPSTDLAGGLDDQETAEALAELKDRDGPAQELVPRAQRDRLHEAVTAKQPFAHALLDRSLAAKGALDPAAGAVGVDGIAVQVPDEQGRHQDPLHEPEQLDEEPSEARSRRGRDAQDRVDRVEGRQRQREGQPARAAADIEGQRDQHDREQEKGKGRQHAKQPHPRGRCARRAEHALIGCPTSRFFSSRSQPMGMLRMVLVTPVEAPGCWMVSNGFTIMR